MMIENTSFIKLYRKMTQWEWDNDHNTTRLFFHLLLTVNWQNKKWRGETIKRGSIITSIEHLSASTGLSVQAVRTALDKLESTGEIKRRSTNYYTHLTICKFDTYQEKPKTDNKRTTNEQQTSNKRTTTTKETKEGEEADNNKLLSATAGAPTCEEVISFFQENGYTKESAIKVWNYYNDGDWHDATGKKVKSWKQKMRGNWFTDENLIKPKNNTGEPDILDF